MKIALVSIPVEDPVAAHEIYTNKLGFVSTHFEPDAMIAAVASPDDPEGTSILLEPCQGTFAESYKQSAYESNLPIMVFRSNDVASEIEQLKARGVVFRPDLDKPDWGLQNLFEDGCGNLLMLENR